MIRIFKLVLLLVCSQVAFGQAPSNYTNINGRYRWIAGMFDSTFHIPKGTTPSLRTGGSTNGGALFYKTADSSLQLYTGTQWLRMLKVGDTTGMLTPYFNSVGVGLKNTGQTVYADTLLLSTRLWRNKGIDSVQANLTAGLATKLNISDTASMLSPYARTVNVRQIVSDSLGGLVRLKALSAAGAALYAHSGTKVAEWGLGGGANMDFHGFAGYDINRASSYTVRSFTDKNYVDSAISASPSGTVTSVGSNNGTGLTGGPITTSGTLAIDTLLVSTRAWRQKGIDSVQGNLTTGLAGKVNISDTASMLTPYLRKIDTTAMLSPYLRANVAAATYAPQSRTITINGTSQDLSANRTFNVGTVTTAAATGGGQVAFFNGSTVLTSISTLYFDGVNKLAIGNSSPDSMLSVTQGAHIQRGVRLSGLSSAPGTRALRINANGTLSVSDTLTNGISGTGTTNYIPKFTSSSAIGNSQVFDNGTNVIVGGTSGLFKFQVNDASLATLGLNATGEATDQKNWTFQYGTSVGAGTFRLRAINDAGTDGQNAYIITRSGTAIQTHQWLTAGSERMRLDASGNLGLGTSSPAVKLDVIGDIHTTTKLAWGSATNGTTGQIATDNTNNYLDYLGALIFRTAAASSEVMRLDASGNLGLGVTPSAWTSIDKEIEIGRAGNSLFSGGLNDMSISSNAYYNSGWKYGATGAANLFSVGYGSNSFVWLTAASGSANAAISFTQAMTLDASGRLGIGTTSPAANLDVQGTNSIITARDASGAVAFLQGVGNSDIRMGASSNHPLLIMTNSTERMRITSGGLVLIGTTSTSGVDKLRVNNDGTTSYSTVNITNANSTANMYVGVGGSAVANGSLQNNAYVWNAAASALLLGTSDTERMRITSGGELLINTTSDAGDYKLQVNGGTLATNYWTPVSASNGYYLLNYNTSNASSRNWRIANDVDTYGDFGVQVATTQGGSTYTNSLILTSTTAVFNGSIKTAAPSGGTAKPYKWGEAGVAIGGSDGYAVKVEIDGTLYYLMTGFPPEPEPDPSAAPSGPSGNYKTYNKPTPTRSIQDTKIAALEKELTELKEMLKSIKK